ncbi:MAG: DUF2341 domain-containing protein [Candidatus Aenigmatarchaeota archaeon]
MENKKGLVLFSVVLCSFILLSTGVLADWSEGEVRTYTFEGDSEAESKYPVELAPGTYQIEMHGADAEDGCDMEDYGFGGSGGYIKGNFTVDSYRILNVWVGEGASGWEGLVDGLWGRHNGGGVNGSNGYGGVGAGSTEAVFGDGSFLAAADGGGGGASEIEVLGTTNYYAGGGGARGGTGGTGDVNGLDAEGGGYGGDGAEEGSMDGEDGGTEAEDMLEVIQESKGGATKGSGGNGYVELKALSLAPNEPTNPDPSDEEIGVSTDPTLSVDASDPDNDQMNVSFYEARDWQYCRNISVSNAVEGYQYYLHITNTTHMDRDSIRIVNASCNDGGSVVDHWTESFAPDDAEVWFKGSGSGTDYALYYNNSEASDASNGDKTFPYFDHWTSDNTDDWRNSNTGNNHHHWWLDNTDFTDSRELKIDSNLLDWNCGDWDHTNIGWTEDKSSYYQDVEHVTIYWEHKDDNGCKDNSTVLVKLHLKNSGSTYTTSLKSFSKPDSSSDIYVSLSYSSDNVSYEIKNLDTGTVLASDFIDSPSKIPSLPSTNYFFFHAWDAGGGIFNYNSPTYLKWGNEQKNGGMEWKTDYWFIKNYDPPEPTTTLGSENPVTVGFYSGLIGTDENVDSGDRASVTWSGLSKDNTYEWYAVADDEKYTNHSSLWSFTTGEEPDSISVKTQPGDTEAGETINGPPEANVTDSDGNGVGGIEVNISESEGYKFDSGTTTNTTESDGTVTFNDLVIETAGTYQLTFDAEGVTDDAVSQDFDISPSDPDNVSVYTQPEDTKVIDPIRGPPESEVVDEYGNAVDGVDVDVFESGGYTFDSGTTTQTTGSEGIATFDDLEIHEEGVYQLTFDTDGADDAVSNNFRMTVNYCEVRICGPQNVCDEVTVRC